MERVRRTTKSGNVSKGEERGHNGAKLSPRERGRLIQLLICAALFLSVWGGHGLFPNQLGNMRTNLQQLLMQDTDVVAVFSNLGASISQGMAPGEAIAQAWVAVMGGAEDLAVMEPQSEVIMIEPDVVEADEAENISLMEETDSPEDLAPAQEVPVPTGALVEPTATLPLDEVVTPVMAVVSSDYGWREHPLTGVEQFHTGLDLAAEYGTEIGSFAAGVVDFIGESPAYGQYIQVDHGDGITSFYAHCSQLCAQPGQVVSAGETIAMVGDTGDVTGTHLHFELKHYDVQLDPGDYIRTLS